MRRLSFKSDLSAGIGALFALAVLAACSGGNTFSPQQSAGGGLVNAPNMKAPDMFVRCIPTGPYKCPTPAPTPTPFNGPVGSGNNLTAKGFPPAVLTSATSHVVYVNQTSTMGDQIAFLKNLEGSAFFSYILNQYETPGTFSVDATPYQISVPQQNGYVLETMPLTGSSCPPGWYSYLPPGGTANECAYNQAQPYVDQDQIESAVKTLMGARVGPQHIWHVVVSADVSMCRRVSGILTCWGVGDGMLNACGRHIGLQNSYGVAYVTEQQDMAACDTDTYADGISSTLSHELFETITDPDGLSGWRSNGDEIGDLCEGISHWIALPLYNPFTQTGTFYDIQPEWSNKDAHCHIEGDQTATLGPI